MNKRKGDRVLAYQLDPRVERVKETLSKSLFLPLVPVVGVRQIELDEGPEVYLVAQPDLCR